jgi:hypothetical protein
MSLGFLVAMTLVAFSIYSSELCRFQNQSKVYSLPDVNKIYVHVHALSYIQYCECRVYGNGAGPYQIALAYMLMLEEIPACARPEHNQI